MLFCKAQRMQNKTQKTKFDILFANTMLNYLLKMIK